MTATRSVPHVLSTSLVLLGALGLFTGLLTSTGCGDDESATGTNAGGAGGATSTTVTSVTVTTAAVGGGGTGGTGGMAEYIPTTADIDFQPVAPLPPGERIVFNSWGNGTDVVMSMAPDGSGLAEIFTAFRVWSLGVSPDRATIAFSCGDKEQAAHYGLNFKDTIQHTWRYDVATQAADLLAYGNINDECHYFAPGNELFVCRRHDFLDQGMGNAGYRIAKIDLATKVNSFITPDEFPSALTLGAVATVDTLYYVRITVSQNTQTRLIMKSDLDGSNEEVFRTNAHRFALSPDGTQYVFADSNDSNALKISDIGNTVPAITIADGGKKPIFSPDGTRVGFLADSSLGPCSHIDTAAVDGSQVGAADRLLDCDNSPFFVTQLAWVGP